MTLLQLFLLFTFILFINSITLKLNYSKIFKNATSRDIFIFNMIVSFVLGYLLYKVIMEIYSLSTSLI